MSKPVSPFAIGSFTIGAVALLIIGIFIFGGGQLFQNDKIQYVVYFDSSLNGMEVGAPVKLQGVKIGEVVDIALLIDPKTSKIYKPVVLEIDRNNLLRTEGSKVPKIKTHAEERAVRDKLVEAGFRARLESQSLLTGLLYVDFDVYKDKPPLYADLKYRGLLEFPGIPTTADEIKNTAEGVIKKLRDLPLEQMVKDFSESLTEVKNLLSSDDVKKSRAALSNTLVELEKTMKTLNGGLGLLLKDTNKTIASTNALVVDVHKDIKPILASLDQTVKSANSTLKATQKSMENIGDTVGPDSNLHETLQSLNEASKSVKNLTDYLERHPEALLSGKD